MIIDSYLCAGIIYYKFGFYFLLFLTFNFLFTGGYQMTRKYLKSGHSFSFREQNPNYSIKEMGIVLTINQKRIILKELESLLEKAPYNSFISLTYLNDSKTLKTSLTISSPNIIFRSSLDGKCAISSFFLAKEDINEQIDNWKKQRLSTLNRPFIREQEAI